MPFNIAEFQANIAAGGGFMKKNKFLVNITPPTSILGRSAGGTSLYSVGRTLEFYAESASIPGISLQTSELRRQGVGNLEKAVYGAALTDVDIRFTIDQYTENFKFFQMWMDTIYNYNPSRGTEYEMEYKDSYCTTLTIFVYNEIEPEQPIMILDLYDAFPVSISDIGLDWGGSDIMKLNVRFNFLSWSERNTQGMGIRGIGGVLNSLNGILSSIGLISSAFQAGNQQSSNYTPTITSNAKFNPVIDEIRSTVGSGAFEI